MSIASVVTGYQQLIQTGKPPGIIGTGKSSSESSEFTGSNSPLTGSEISSYSDSPVQCSIYLSQEAIIGMVNDLLLIVYTFELIRLLPR